MRQVILSVCALTAASAAASAQVFLFNSPNFTPGESTPLLNRAPDIGGPLTGITASFETPLNGAPLFVAPDDPASRPNGLMDGQFLIASSPTSLVITFSQPVSSIDFDFALDSRTGGAQLAWILTLSQTPGGQYATDVGGGNGYWGGHVHIPGGNFGIQQILMGAGDATHQILFSIDNLAVPTPSTAAAIGFAAAASLRRRRR